MILHPHGRAPEPETAHYPSSVGVEVVVGADCGHVGLEGQGQLEQQWRTLEADSTQQTST
uniref:Uncharacterized protein n=1 Tax=Arundo donax TaxID=35708 RepID=A0A0A9BWY6_ARUDO